MIFRLIACHKVGWFALHLDKVFEKSWKNLSLENLRMSEMCFSNYIVGCVTHVFQESENISSCEPYLRIFPSLLRVRWNMIGPIGVQTVCKYAIPKLRPPNSTRWWFHIFFMFTSTWGNDPIWRAYFSVGLVQPPPTSAVSIHLFLFITYAASSRSRSESSGSRPRQRGFLTGNGWVFSGHPGCKMS